MSSSNSSTNSPAPGGSISQRLAATAVSWQDEIIYHVVLDRFQSSRLERTEMSARSPFVFHGGDLLGLLARLPYIAELGATVVWLGPLYEQREALNRRTDGCAERLLPGQTAQDLREAYHGYHPWDFRRIDPHFGTLDDLRAVVARAHDLGLKIMLDMVVNHAGYEFPGLPEHGLSPVHDDKNGTFHHIGDFLDDTPAADWNDPFKLESYALFALPDFDQDNPVVADYLIGSAHWWLEQSRGGARARGGFDEVGIDAIRMDTVKHVSRRFWREAWHPRVTLAEAHHGQRPGKLVFTVGEVMHGSVDFVAPYQHEGFPSVLDFPLYYSLVDAFARGGPMLNLAAVFAQDDAYLDPHLLVTFIDNHDTVRFTEEASRSAGGDLPEAHRRLRSALSFLATCRGIPCLYYGTELGLRGADSSLGRGDMHAFCPTERTEFEQDIFSHVQALCRMRHANPALTHGKQRVVMADADAIVVRRALGDEIVLIAARASGGGGPRRIRVAHGHVQVTGATRALDELLPPEVPAGSAVLVGGDVCVDIPPGAVRILRISSVARRALPLWTSAPSTAVSDAPPRPRPYPIQVGDQQAWVHDEGFAAGYFHTYDAFVGGPRGERRKIHVFLPRDYPGAHKPYRVLLVNDGHTAFWPGGIAGQTWGIADVLAAEYAGDTLGPIVVAAVVPSPVREHDYSLTAPDGRGGGGVAAYGEYLDAVMSFLERHYHVSGSPADHALIGASRGGLAALHVGTRHPARFGKVAAMSPSLWHGIPPELPLRESRLVTEVSDVLADPSRRPRIWFDWGTARTGHPEAVRHEQRARARCQEMAAVLIGQFGYQLGDDISILADAQGEHNEMSWRRRLPLALRWLFPQDAAPP